MSRQPIAITGVNTPCTLCSKDGPLNEATHLELYVSGSEGITVCRECRLLLTKTAEGMMHMMSESLMRGYQEGLDAARKYDKEHQLKGV